MKSSVTLEDGTENSVWNPIDLIIEILLRLPVNSIARCRCVSKLWATILSRTDFTELFLTRSLARPKLLFACRRVCFDVRSEEFRFINKPAYDGTLINYNGKLGLFSLGNAISCDRIRNMELWVLEDAGKQEWSKHTYLLPAMWQNIVGNTNLRFVGMTLTKEFVFQSMRGCTPFYLVYYNIERNTVKKVELQGMEMSNNIHTFVDHVENVTLMQII
ncbi:PREDICTED: putative F-box protein At2g19630 [Camelina sativa]|uniref:F-box protein At2g19630 n=1 Tax=Camelina sativa TaxID=90675 RepID=A0ABM0Y5R5_CAMSA|nr:PREDICTED: putative F-box protein At2g19630 [Camelina sativa]